MHTYTTCLTAVLIPTSPTLLLIQTLTTVMVPTAEAPSTPEPVLWSDETIPIVTVAPDLSNPFPPNVVNDSGDPNLSWAEIESRFEIVHVSANSPASSNGGWITDIPFDPPASSPVPSGLGDGLEEVAQALWPIRERLFLALRDRGLGRWELSLLEAAEYVLRDLPADGSSW